MGLIQIDDGTAVLLDEITAATAAGGQPPHVTVARCSPELMAGALGAPAGAAAPASAPAAAVAGTPR